MCSKLVMAQAHGRKGKYGTSPRHIPFVISYASDLLQPGPHLGIMKAKNKVLKCNILK